MHFGNAADRRPLDTALDTSAPMRYLHPTDVASTLRRGRSIEQFLGGGNRGGTAILSCIEVRPTPEGFEVWLHEPDDLGSEEFLDFYESIDNEAVPVRLDGTPEDAIAAAHADLGARPEYWVNLGMAQDEYRDFILAGRAPAWRKAVRS